MKHFIPYAHVPETGPQYVNPMINRGPYLRMQVCVQAPEFMPAFSSRQHQPPTRFHQQQQQMPSLFDNIKYTDYPYNSPSTSSISSSSLQSSPLMAVEHTTVQSPPALGLAKLGRICKPTLVLYDIGRILLCNTIPVEYF